jgi:peptidoglycan-N-acetylglucosamine deacetylase
MSTGARQKLVSLANKVGNTLLSPPFGGRGFFVNNGSRENRRIALTFDDGPTQQSTDLLLDALAEFNIKATFFCVGVNVVLNDKIVARAYADGHVIGNHSMNHGRKEGLQVYNDGHHIDQGAAEIYRIIGLQPCLYRPPWGWLTPWEGRRLASRGYTIVGWDVYTLDWQYPEKDGHWIADTARAQARPGSILLFHDGIPGAKIWHKQETIRAIKRIVPMLLDDGYTFVTVPELLDVPAYTESALNTYASIGTCS